VLLVVPEVPGQPSGKPLVQGYGCHLRDGTLFCEALFVAASIPDQQLVGELRQRHGPAKPVRLDWTTLEPALYQNASIDTVKEETL
jgi:hypothetical protein